MAPTGDELSSKKQKVDGADLDIVSRIEEERKNVGDNILDFKFNKKRVEMISKASDVPDDSQGIVYWMCRDQRVQGVMWSICGIHDQGWKERPIFGKIRYMNYDGCKRKFKIEAFVARYGGKRHKYVPST